MAKKIETRDFPTAVVISLVTGTMFFSGPFSVVAEAAQFVLGHEIWTHHFANKQLWDDMRRVVLEQCPGIPTDVGEVTKENYPTKLAAIEAQIGKVVRLRKGSGLTAMLPTDGIPDHMKDNVIVIGR